MRRIYKSKINIADTAAYLYILGALFALLGIAKKCIKAMFNHFVELLTATAFVAVFITANAFDSGTVPFVAVVFAMVFLAITSYMFIKIKINKEF